MGSLVDLTGDRGFIDLGLNAKATVALAICSHRRRRHRYPVFNRIEDELAAARRSYNPDDDDVVLWKHKLDLYKPMFRTKATWDQIRQTRPVVAWSKGVWFRHNTPKFAFHVWVTILNRLPTGDRMLSWSDSISTSCVFCLHPLESRDHLFFDCPYTLHVWTDLASSILGNEFTQVWEEIVALLTRPNQDRVRKFRLRYLFHSVLYHIWSERNGRRHGDTVSSSQQLIKKIDKGMKDRFSAIRLLGDVKYEKGLQYWMASRQAS